MTPISPSNLTPILTKLRMPNMSRIGTMQENIAQILIFHSRSL